MDAIFRLSTLLAAETESGGAHEGLSYIGLMAYIFFVVVVICGFLAVAKKGLNTRFFKNKTTQLLEQLYIFIEGMAVGIIGPHGRKYIPMLITFWMVIFVGNLTALFLHASPTADLGFNLGMALIAVGYVQWEGMRANGVVGHFRHFAGPQLPWYMFIITLMIFVIEIISETMKNVSLSLRLFGNMHGGHEAVVSMNKLTEGSPMAWLPIGDFLLPIKLLTCVVQALIFCLLFAVYLSLVTHHEDHGDSHDHGHEGSHAPAH